MVGCPHRLRAPIGSRTKYPCDACAPYGPPGWPRWAIAMTVDYGPRLSRAAVGGATAVPTIPPPPAPVTVAGLVRAVRESLDRIVAHPTLIERAQQVVIEQGDLNIVMQPQTEADQRANIIRMTAEQAIRFRSR